jgi:hypothetical protein
MAAQRAISVAEELRFEVYGLHRPFVKIVDVRFLGHRCRKLLLRRGCHVVHLELKESGGAVL